MKKPLQAGVLPKARTGIAGLDDITLGGLPRGRPTLICGSAGSGKTLLSMEFLVRGATQFNEPGVFVSFEETAKELSANVRSLGFRLDNLVSRKKLILDFVYIERSEIEETGDYNLDGLFVRLGHAIDSIGAKRVVLDTLEALFSGLPNQSILRAELRRLFRWLKDRGVTAMITGERGDGQLTRYGLEEYVADCVILLDHRVDNQVSTRRMRIVKYRGSLHGTNEYPFLIDEQGFSVLPITSLGLSHKALPDRISTGVPELDTMLGGQGLFRGTSVLLSGTAGSGKSTLAAHLADACCRRGEKAIYFAFEESPSQITRNMRSVGIDLEQHVRKGLLQFYASRPTAFGLEMHLAMMHKHIADFKPAMVVADPVTNFLAFAISPDIKAMLTRLIDFLKTDGVTGIFTSLTNGGDALEQSEIGISSLMDTWILVKMIEHDGERNRGIYVLKSRGMAHSNQIREFLITDTGIKLVDVYLGDRGVVMGSARLSQEAGERAEELLLRQASDQRRRDLERKKKVLDAQILALRAQFDSEKEELMRSVSEARDREEAVALNRRTMAARRMADDPDTGGSNGHRRRS